VAFLVNAAHRSTIRPSGNSSASWCAATHGRAATSLMVRKPPLGAKQRGRNDQNTDRDVIRN